MSHGNNDLAPRRKTVHPRHRGALVSVIIPAYNSVAYIGQALESVLGQTYRNIEIIVIDDGSTDGTGGCIGHYGPGVTYIRQENQGPATARNVGILRARGTYLAFLDADDVWLPEKIEEQVRYLESSPDMVLVYTNFVKSADGTPVGPVQCATPAQREEGAVFEQMLNSDVRSRPRVLPSSVVMRRNIIARAGLFDPFIAGPGGEDREFWIRVASVGNFGFVDRVLWVYRQHETNSVGSLGFLYNKRRSHRLMRIRWAEDAVAARGFRGSVGKCCWSIGKRQMELGDYSGAAEAFWESALCRINVLRATSSAVLCHAISGACRARHTLRRFRNGR